MCRAPRATRVPQLPTLIPKINAAFTALEEKVTGINSTLASRALTHHVPSTDAYQGSSAPPVSPLLPFPSPSAPPCLLLTVPTVAILSHSRAGVSEAHVHAHQKEILELRARIKTLEEENTKLSSEKMTALVDAAHAKGVVGQLKEQLAQQTKSMETWVRQFQTRCHYDWSDADGSVM